MDLVVQVLCRDSVLSRKSSYAKQLFEGRLGRGDEKNINNKEEVAKKRTTVNENLAGGDRIQNLDATQGIGNRRPVRSSAKKAVGWYIEEEQESHSCHFLYYLVGTLSPILTHKFCALRNRIGIHILWR